MTRITISTHFSPSSAVSPHLFSHIIVAIISIRSLELVSVFVCVFGECFASLLPSVLRGLGVCECGVHMKEARE